MHEIFLEKSQGRRVLHPPITMAGRPTHPDIPQSTLIPPINRPRGDLLLGLADRVELTVAGEIPDEGTEVIRFDGLAAALSEGTINLADEVHSVGVFVGRANVLRGIELGIVGSLTLDFTCGAALVHGSRLRGRCTGDDRLTKTLNARGNEVTRVHLMALRSRDVGGDGARNSRRLEGERLVGGPTSR